MIIFVYKALQGRYNNCISHETSTISTAIDRVTRSNSSKASNKSGGCTFSRQLAGSRAIFGVGVRMSFLRKQKGHGKPHEIKAFYQCTVWN